MRDVLVPGARGSTKAVQPLPGKPEPVCREESSCWIYGALGASICQVPQRQPWHWHRWRWIFIQSSEPSDSINPQGFDDEFLSFFILFIFTLTPPPTALQQCGRSRTDGAFRGRPRAHEDRKPAHSEITWPHVQGKALISPGRRTCNDVRIPSGGRGGEG